jgi:hypothetical protein
VGHQATTYGSDAGTDTTYYDTIRSWVCVVGESSIVSADGKLSPIDQGRVVVALGIVELDRTRRGALFVAIVCKIISFIVTGQLPINYPHLTLD